MVNYVRSVHDMKQIILFLTALCIFSSCADQEIIGIPPSSFLLEQNYPNPFTDTTRIIYGVPSTGAGNPGPWIRVVVYDRFLQRQATLVEDSNHPAKTDTLLWLGRGPNGAKVPPGLYYIELQQRNQSQDSNDEDFLVVLRRTAVKN